MQLQLQHCCGGSSGTTRATYREQVRPFRFLLAFQARGSRLAAVDPLAAAGRGRGDGDLSVPAVAAPYERDAQIAARGAFDRETGEPVPVHLLRTYREVLAQYHLHPEAKFHGGEYLDSGPTTRRHVRPLGPIDNIGKEANRWEEQFYLGANPETQIGYGADDREISRYRAEVAERARGHAVRDIADRAGVAVGTVSTVQRSLGNPTVATLRAIDRAIEQLPPAPRREGPLASAPAQDHRCDGTRRGRSSRRDSGKLADEVGVGT